MYVPEGIFITGSLQLRSNIIFQLDEGAILRGSPDIEDYGVKTASLQWGAFWQFASSQWKQSLLYAEDAEHIKLEGKGTIDGQGAMGRHIFPNPGDTRRPMLVRFQNCLPGRNENHRRKEKGNQDFGSGHP